MAKVELPKSEFTPHPAGQHEGTIYDYELQFNQETPFGPKDRIILKIVSDKPLLDEDGRQRSLDDGTPLYFNQWEWINISRKGKLRERREGVLGRELTPDEIESSSFDPEAEFIGKRVGYVIKHNVANNGRTYANVEALWRLDSQTLPSHAQALLDKRGQDAGFDPSALEQDSAESASNGPVTDDMLNRIIDLESSMGWSKEQIEAARLKYAGAGDLAFASEQGTHAYLEKLEAVKSMNI